MWALKRSTAKHSTAHSTCVQCVRRPPTRAIPPTLTHTHPHTCARARAQPFTDVLHALVFEGADISIPLSATGVGNILLCEEVKGGALECGHQFVGRGFARDIVIHNMGRKAQVRAVAGNAWASGARLPRALCARACVRVGHAQARCAAPCCLPACLLHTPPG